MNDASRNPESNPSEDSLTQMIRDGVPQPKGIKESLQMTADKLTGRVPLGATAQNKTIRKTIAGGSALLGVVKFAFLGIILAPLGALLLVFSFVGSFQWKSAAISAVITLLGVWSLKTAWRSYRNLRTISKA